MECSPRGWFTRTTHKHKSKPRVNRTTQAQEKGAAFLFLVLALVVLASSRFTRGLCLCLSVFLRRTCKPALSGQDFFLPFQHFFKRMTSTSTAPRESSMSTRSSSSARTLAFSLSMLRCWFCAQIPITMETRQLTRFTPLSRDPSMA